MQGWCGFSDENRTEHLRKPPTFSLRGFGSRERERQPQTTRAASPAALRARRPLRVTVRPLETTSCSVPFYIEEVSGFHLRRCNTMTGSSPPPPERAERSRRACDMQRRLGGRCGVRRRCARPQVERRRLGDEPWGRRGGRRRDAAVTFTARHGGASAATTTPAAQTPQREEPPN